ncbi:MAG TPA: TonB C-terminal domain-containing protein [Blastocatellia bacterium]|nr:TonB C-terminal domain-containing protein [Blastocatellia bacterium]
MLKTLDRYIDDTARSTGPLAPLWSRLGRDRRFTFLFAASMVVHVVFYAALIKLDSWAMLRAIASNKRPVSLVQLIELAPPPERGALRSAPEPLERADVSRLQFDPASADDVHLVPRSPRTAQRRGTTGPLPAANLIENQLRASRGSGGAERSGLTSQRPSPPVTSSIQANRIGNLDEAMISQTPPAQAGPVPPAPAPKQAANTTGTGLEGVAPPGTRRASDSESIALGLEAAQGQYMALVRAKISKVNERIMPREWIKDVLRDKVSADFSLVIKRDGQILSSRLLRSSGYSVLDGYARQAIFTASPFEGFPQAAGNTIVFTVTVYFYTL